MIKCIQHFYISKCRYSPLLLKGRFQWLTALGSLDLQVECSICVVKTGFTNKIHFLLVWLCVKALIGHELLVLRRLFVGVCQRSSVTNSKTRSAFHQWNLGWFWNKKLKEARIWLSLISENYWWHLFHKIVNSWYSTTRFRMCWQFQTPP